MLCGSDFEERLSWVYGAALRAAADDTAAEEAARSAFDWAGSDNLNKAEVLWPAPQRVEDAGGVSYVYKDRVLLPLRAEPRDTGKPVRLALKIDYGVCKEICIPAQASIALDLLGSETLHRPAVEAALARVPKPQALGAPHVRAKVVLRDLDGLAGARMVEGLQRSATRRPDGRSLQGVSRSQGRPGPRGLRALLALSAARAAGSLRDAPVEVSPG